MLFDVLLDSCCAICGWIAVFQSTYSIHQSHTSLRSRYVNCRFLSCLWLFLRFILILFLQKS